MAAIRRICEMPFSEMSGRRTSMASSRSRSWNPAPERMCRAESHRRDVLGRDLLDRAQVQQRAGLVEPEQVEPLEGRAALAASPGTRPPRRPARNRCSRPPPRAAPRAACAPPAPTPGPGCGRAAAGGNQERAEAGGPGPLHRGHQLRVRVSRERRQRPRLVARRPAEHLVDGRLGGLADDVEQRHVDGRAERADSGQTAGEHLVEMWPACLDKRDAWASSAAVAPGAFAVARHARPGRTRTIVETPRETGSRTGNGVSSEISKPGSRAAAGAADAWSPASLPLLSATLSSMKASLEC